MDVFSKQKRSAIMANVKSKGNKTTEIAMIQLFKNSGIHGWRRNALLTGKPDFIFPQKKVVVFVDGCFWHGHNCRGLTPATNRKFWEEKLRKNKERDKRVSRNLRRQGWSVHRIWECKIKRGRLSAKLVTALEKGAGRV